MSDVACRVVSDVVCGVVSDVACRVMSDVASDAANQDWHESRVPELVW